MQLIKFFNLSLCVTLLFSFETVAQRKNKSQKNKVSYDQSLYSSLKFREVGPFRGGRSCAVTGVEGNPNLFYLDQPEVEFGKLMMEEKLMKIFQMVILVEVLVLSRFQKVIQTLFMLEGEK